jgi:hypothetical protein
LALREVLHFLFLGLVGVHEIRVQVLLMDVVVDDFLEGFREEPTYCADLYMVSTRTSVLMKETFVRGFTAISFWMMN